MPIRVAPFDSIDAALIATLRSQRVREDRTLDYKRDLNLVDRDAQSEFLKDVTAFANGSGGTLLYGVAEGEGEEQGLIVDLPGLELARPDDTHRLVDELLRHSVDERMMGVLHRAVPRPDQRFYYLVRVPPSPLAPHMVMLGKHKSKFFLRANTTTDVMDARQIKETALRTASAFDRAQAIIEDRRRILIARAERAPEEGGVRDHPTDDTSQLLLHVVPLFPPPGGFALSDDRVVHRLAEVGILGWTTDYNSHLFTLEGLYFSYGNHARAGYLRSGAAEFQEYEIAAVEARPSSSMDTVKSLKAWQIEQDVLLTLDACAGLTADGLLPLPLVISLTLTGIQGSKLTTSPRAGRVAPNTMDVDVVSLTPIVLHSWDRAAAAAVRTIFDEMYQGWGLPRSSNYRDGVRIWWSSHDRAPAPTPAYWTSGWDMN